jgi:hypothetical protein
MRSLLLLAAAAIGLAPGSAWAQVGPGALVNCLERGFSSEQAFLDRGPTPPDGNPLISGGDLFAANCALCARNVDLVGVFGVTDDLGLDAADVIDGNPVLAVFSTELDGPPDVFTAGDLLATNGAAIPNVALTHLFGVGRDIGLDAVHVVGSPDDIVAFLGDASNVARAEWLAAPEILEELLDLHDVDIWFSTEGSDGSAIAPTLLDGDVLSAANGVVRVPHAQLFPATVPAGLPTRGIDFGVDALSADRAGSIEQIWFSTEVGHPAETGLRFGHADLLVLQANAVARPGPDVVSCFEPKSFDLGVDAVLPEPGGPATLILGAAAIWLLGAHRRTGAGRAPRLGRIAGHTASESPRSVELPAERP